MDLAKCTDEQIRGILLVIFVIIRIVLLLGLGVLLFLLFLLLLQDKTALRHLGIAPAFSQVQFSSEHGHVP